MRSAGSLKNLKHLPLKQLRIEDAFWDRYTALVTGEIIPYQFGVLNDPASCCIRNLRIAAGLEEGTFEGFVCQDTDLAKWLEAVAYSLSYEENPELERTADEMIRLIGMAQEDNGYLDTYFSILHPEKQFCNLKEGHELYTAGHFIEAAVAYYQVTGKDEFLNIMCACADNICRVFRQPDYLDAVPGHEEIELALIKLADATGKEDYRDMALEFVNRRGCSDYLSREHTLERYIDVWHDRNPYLPAYGQAHKPVREQDSAEGHAVRALYLYCAMADLAQQYDDGELLDACKKLYDNITQKRMYITGGVGSSGVLERFTTDYDLPNTTNYSESCASIALALFCRRMARITGDAKYMDTAELALMNTVLAGVALDGKSFFYVNPLEVVPAACMPATDKNHAKTRRQGWFGCACCPPNIARTLASLGEYIFFRDDRSLWVNLFISGTYQAEIGGAPIQIQVKSGLPYQGDVSIVLKPETGAPLNCELRLRIPDYAQEPRITVNGSAVSPKVEQGYAVIPLAGDGAEIDYRFDIPAQLIYANPRVSDDAGKCAVKKGPLVYCLEGQDNGENLAALLIDPTKPLTERFDKTLFGGTVTITAEGWRQDGEEFGQQLYRSRPPQYRPSLLRFIPYCFWANREEGEMTVWVRYSSGTIPGSAK